MTAATHPDQRRLLRGISSVQPRLDLTAHLREHGPIPAAIRTGQTDLLDHAEAVDLRGRGGAAFPLARKAKAVRAVDGRALVVGNGSEGEPASRKDATLSRPSPSAGVRTGRGSRLRWSVLPTGSSRASLPR
jgi:NADH:ubiquinone oxidoreductase subunit F (NADH-binding)